MKVGPGPDMIILYYIWGLNTMEKGDLFNVIDQIVIRTKVH